jgi:biopolymer transport protein TolQ
MVEPMAPIALFLQAEVHGNVTDLLVQTGPVAKGVLILLLVFSVFSWAIIYSKWRRFKKLRAQSEVFLRGFRKARRLSEFNILVENFPPHPLKSVFEAGYSEVVAQVGNPGGPVKNPAALTRALQIASTQQLSELEKNLSWLATTGSVAPFIGLFGTVWGIMDAFLGLGSAGTASLRVVAPGIAEALIVTAAGLFVAVPAVIAYNQFLSRVRELGATMDNFSLEFINAAERG